MLGKQSQPSYIQSIMKRHKMVTRRDILFDKDLSESSKHLGNLPEWDLNDLYANTHSPELKEDLNWLQKECKLFATEFLSEL